MGLAVFIWLAVALPMVGVLKAAGSTQPITSALCWPLVVVFFMGAIPLAVAVITGIGLMLLLGVW